jgi:hypothetical protein
MTAYRDSIISVPDNALKELIKGEVHVDVGPEELTLVAAPKRRFCCPASVTSALSSMLNFNLFKSQAFRLFCTSGFLASLGFVVTPYYLAGKSSFLVITVA